MSWLKCAPKFTVRETDAYLAELARLLSTGDFVTRWAPKDDLAGHGRTAVASATAQQQFVELWTSTSVPVPAEGVDAALPVSHAFDAATFYDLVDAYADHDTTAFVADAKTNWAPLAEHFGVPVDRLIAGTIMGNYRAHGRPYDLIAHYLRYTPTGQAGCHVMAGMWRYNFAIAVMTASGSIEPYSGPTPKDLCYAYDYYHMFPVSTSGRRAMRSVALFQNVTSFTFDHHLVYRRTDTTLPLVIWQTIEQILSQYGVPIYYYTAQLVSKAAAALLPWYMCCGTVKPFADIILIPMYDLCRRWPTIVVTKTYDGRPADWIVGVFEPSPYVAFFLGTLPHWVDIIHSPDLQDWYRFNYGVNVRFLTFNLQ
jgi:hypothetical protein